MSSQSAPSLYLHVPFCAHKCSYCAFFSQAPSATLMERFVSALVRELELIACSQVPDTIFFGGGTPSLLTITQWKTILSALERLGLLGAKEWTVECNPATLSLEKARLLKTHGVTRISMGVQSLDPDLLERLGRIHTRETALKSFDLLRKAGFENINIDLMFAIPGQTLQIWRETLHDALALGTEHLSCYEVIYEEDTPLFEQLAAGEFKRDEDLACAMYDELLDKTAQAGFQQYEIANFARPQPGSAALIPAYACRHNLHYWQGSSYHGLGPSAAGFLQGIRTKNISNITRYCQELEEGRLPLEWTEQLTPMARAGEIAAFGLRMNSGWNFERFLQTTGFDLRCHWKEPIQELVQLGWAARDSERFYLTPLGLRFADAAGERFIHPERPSFNLPKDRPFTTLLANV
jgi:oxygen-independent coproporphyrinogen III oxidase